MGTKEDWTQMQSVDRLEDLESVGFQRDLHAITRDMAWNDELDAFATEPLESSHRWQFFPALSMRHHFPFAAPL